MGASTLAQARQTDAKSKSLADPRFRVVRVAFWFVAGTIGFLQIWLQDRTIWADTLSYLDSGDMLWQGDLKNAITCHWSPGYPFLLGLALKVFHPVGLWEVAVVKLVDLILFLFTLACFDFFVNQFCLYHETSASSEQRGLKLVVPKIALASVAYLLFIWTITRLLIAWFSTPDMLVMGIMFLIFGLLLKVKLGNTGFPIFAALGLVLGFGYWIKAPLFPLAFMFLAVVFLLVGDRRRATPRVLVSFALFALIAMPLVIKLSASAGKLTFGTSGAWNYARTVNGIAFAYHWHGRPPGSGTPLHPTREIFQSPIVYEFGSPVRGTYPPWRDPYYWFAGITPHFDLHGQWRVLKENAKILKEEASGLNGGFIYGFFVLLLMSSDRRLIGEVIARQWFLLLPCIATLAMFSVVLVQDRYIAPYPIVIGLIAFSGLAIVRLESSVKLVNMTVLLAALLFAADSAKPAVAELRSFKHSLHHEQMLGRGEPWHLSTEAVSNALRAHGLRTGDRVAYIGEGHDFYWARLAGIQVNAEIRQWDLNNSFYELVPYSTLVGVEPSVDLYWAAPAWRKADIDNTLRGSGSKAIVSDALPTGGVNPGWDPVPGTTFYIHLLTGTSDGAGAVNSQRPDR